jgi:hypothetical protein
VYVVPVCALVGSVAKIVPVVVIGVDDALDPQPVEMLVTVPPPPGGAAKVPSALKKFVVPPPDNGTQPDSVELKALQRVVSCVAVKAIGAAVPPETFPSAVLLAIVASDSVPVVVIVPPVNPVPVATEVTVPLPTLLLHPKAWPLVL